MTEFAGACGSHSFGERGKVRQMTDEASKDKVRRYWNAEPCGTKTADAAPGTAEFFAEVERHRREAEPFIPSFARFAETSGQDVLEIGVGLGTDFIQFVRAGANATGVDLTERSIEMVQERLALENLTAECAVADAEALPFGSDRFDVVYSWGVLHHSPDTERAVLEAIRVCKPGGRVCIMLYGRKSWLTYALWVRYALLTGHPTRSIDDVVAANMESYGTRVFRVADLRRMFSSLEDINVTSVSTIYDRRCVGPLATATERLGFGWFVVTTGRKPG